MIIYEYCFISTKGKEGSPNECNTIYYPDGQEDATKSKWTLTDVLNDISTVGWEMIGCGNTGKKSHNIYFRRDSALYKNPSE